MCLQRGVTGTLSATFEGDGKSTSVVQQAPHDFFGRKKLVLFTRFETSEAIIGYSKLFACLGGAENSTKLQWIGCLLKTICVELLVAMTSRVLL